MVLSNKPPAGAGRVDHITKTDRLIAEIKRQGTDRIGTPVGIRTAALAEATGISASSISVLLTPAVKRGDVCVCKVTSAKGQSQNEYRTGGGMAVPEFKPLNLKRGGVALKATTKPIHPAVPLSTPRPTVPETPMLLQPQPAVGNTGSSRPDTSERSAGARAVTATATPKPSAGARLKEEPATRKASAGDATYRGALDIRIDHEGTLTISTVETVIELGIDHTLALGDFLHATQGVWRP